MKKTLLVLLVLLAMCLTSCFREDTTQLAKDEFSKYYNGKNEVVLFDNDFYFENYVVRDEDLEPTPYGCEVIYEGNIYYLDLTAPTFPNFGPLFYSIDVYTCDLNGENETLIYSHPLNINNKPEDIAIDDSYYIRYKKDGIYFIDKYTISSNTYENIASGKKCKLSDYLPKETPSKYNIEVIENPSLREHGKFIITDSETGITKYVDDEFLKNTIYIDSMQMFNYGPKRCDISNGHILLTYDIGAGDGWNFPFLIFEYDFEQETLEYKALIFSDSSIPLDIVYIGD